MLEGLVGFAEIIVFLCILNTYIHYNSVIIVSQHHTNIRIFVNYYITEGISFALLLPGFGKYPLRHAFHNESEAQQTKPYNASPITLDEELRSRNIINMQVR